MICGFASVLQKCVFKCFCKPKERDMKTLKYRTFLLNLFLKTHGYTKEEFCKKCNIQVSVLQKIYNQEECVLISLYKLTNFMRLTLKQFLIEKD